MKQDPKLDEAQENMKPGAITKDGFMGSDDRNLIDVLIEDDAAVKRMGLSHVDIASKMRKLRIAGKGGLGDFISVPPHFEVKVDFIRGKMPCPFGHPGVLRKSFIIVRNLKSSSEIKFSDMSIHLIEAHGFYQGRGSPYRLEPKDLVEILEIETETES